MNRTSRSWRGARGAAVLLLGLLLNNCEALWVGGSNDPRGDGTAFKTLSVECLEVSSAGKITEFLYTQPGCDLKVFAIPAKKGNIEITAIGNNVFKTRDITRVTIPNSVETIGTYAFFKNKLARIIIPSKLITIEEAAFRKNNLTDLTIPDSVETIGKDAFSENELTRLSIPNKVKTIGEGAFFKNKLTELTIPNSVTSIGDHAFSANPNLVSVTLDPNAIEFSFSASSFPGNLWDAYNGANKDKAGTWVKGGTPPRWAFTLPAGCFTVNADGTITKFLDTQPGCDLKEFAIPAKKGSIEITAIENNEFQGKFLSYVSIPDSVKTIGQGAFRRNQLKSLSIGNSVKTIGDSAFQDNQLKSLSIGNSVKTIGNSAFRDNLLSNLSIGNSVETIKGNAFSENQLRSLTIPNSVKRIEQGAFADNPNLRTVDLNPNARLGFFPNSFSNGDLWTPFDAQDPKQAGTWTYDGSTWSFSR